MGVERGDSAPQLGRTGLKKKVLLLVTKYIQAFSIPLSYQRKATHEQSKPFASQGLLKDQLEIVKVKSNGKIRYAIQPLEEQLSFDKVSIRLCYGLAEKTCCSRHVQHFHSSEQSMACWRCNCGIL